MADIKKIALVTGATGFVGKHLSKKLINEGWQVHAIIRPVSDIKSLEIFLDGKITCHNYAGRNDKILTIMKDIKPTIVFHLASLFLQTHTYSDILPLVQSNIVFSTHLVEAMTTVGVYNLINTGTSWQHYNSEEYNPVCLYAATKQAFEALLSFYQKTTPLQAITLKLFDTYGSDDNRKKLFYLLNKVAQENQPLDMSPGEQYIDLVYIDDVVDAFLLAAQYLENKTKYCQGDYAVTSGNPIKLRDLVEVYEQIINQRLNINWGGRPYRNKEVMIPWSTCRILPGWKPQVELKEGIKIMLNI